MKYKLGRLPVKPHPKTLMFAKYVLPGAARLASLPGAAARKVYREYKTPDAAKQMFGNDKYGDCTCAAAANKFILDSCHTGKVIIPTTDEVLALYSAVTGFNKNDSSTDQGAAMTDVLAYLQATGMTIGGQVHKILGWAQIDIANLEHRRLACQIFDGTYVGVNLPASAQDQFVDGQECHFEVVADSPNDGGHSMFRPGYGALGSAYVTWANWYVKASAAWEQAFVDEDYAIITPEWFEQATQKTPGGLDLATLQADLEAIATP
ncbi:MAG: hypothetical protein ABSG04_17065 [Verrucomicrobiota bacterium]